MSPSVIGFSLLIILSILCIHVQSVVDGYNVTWSLFPKSRRFIVSLSNDRHGRSLTYLKFPYGTVRTEQVEWINCPLRN